MRIPMSSPDLTDAEIEAVDQVLQTRYLSLGPQLEAFERALAFYVGARHAVGVNSGTSGLHLAIIVAGVQEGDLVITTPFSFIASAQAGNVGKTRSLLRELVPEYTPTQAWHSDKPPDEYAGSCREQLWLVN